MNRFSTLERMPRLRTTPYPTKKNHTISMNSNDRSAFRARRQRREEISPALIISDNFSFLRIIARVSRFHCSSPRVRGEWGGNGNSMWDFISGASADLPRVTDGSLRLGGSTICVGCFSTELADHPYSKLCGWVCPAAWAGFTCM